MQKTVNYFGCFIGINLGWPSRVHDARIWTNSNIFAELRSSTFFESGLMDTIHGQEFTDLYLRGYVAYHFSPYLAKGFTGSALSKTYNFLAHEWQ